MNRNKFLKVCCYSMIGAPSAASLLQSCSAVYYANFRKDSNKWIVPKSEFVQEKKGKYKNLDFILIKPENLDFPLCLYKTGDNQYTASLLRCTHRGCELNVGGGIYSCPCHGSEFSVLGNVIEGPANQDLKIFRTDTDHENIYIFS